jgi:hypothetical protein
MVSSSKNSRSEENTCMPQKLCAVIFCTLINALPSCIPYHIFFYVTVRTTKQRCAGDFYAGLSLVGKQQKVVPPEMHDGGVILPETPRDGWDPLIVGVGGGGGGGNY